jgi:hypothetical protein
MAQQPHRAAPADRTVGHPRHIDHRHIAARDAVDFRIIEEANFGLSLYGLLAGHLRSPLSEFALRCWVFVLAGALGYLR